MGNYNPVYKAIWTSQKFQAISPNEKLIYFNLLTNEKTQPTGIYQIMPKQVACDCDLPTADVEVAFEKFIEIGLIQYWAKDNVIYIRNFFKFSKGTIKNPAVLNSAIKRQIELLEHVEAWQLFSEEYNNIPFINDLLMNHQANNSNNNSSNKNKSNSNSNSNSQVKDLEELV